MKTSILVPLFALLASGTAAAEHEPLRLEIGDPERKNREVELVLDAIVDTRTGEALTPAGLAKRLAGTRLLFVGESHTDMDFHRAQLRILQELRSAGRKVMIGLEMYPNTEQSHLDAWTGGLYSESGFLELSDWYGSWSYHWNYYRDIFLFARQHNLSMYAVNTPRHVIRAVREKGFDDLTEEEREHVPPEVDVTSAEHRRLFRSYFDEDDPLHAQMTDEQWDGMIRAQATWDAAMAYNSIRALEKHPEPETILVVLIGSGHVAYGLGIERQAAHWFGGEMASVIPVPVGDGEAVRTVRASYTDFLWGLPHASEPLYPSLGFSSRKPDDDELRKVIYVAEGSLAESAGLEVGDILHSLDGMPLDQDGVYAHLMSTKRWGDEVTLTVRRGEETLEIPCPLRRQRPEDREDEGDE